MARVTNGCVPRSLGGGTRVRYRCLIAGRVDRPHRTGRDGATATRRPDQHERRAAQTTGEMEVRPCHACDPMLVGHLVPVELREPKPAASRRERVGNPAVTELGTVPPALEHGGVDFVQLIVVPFSG